MYANDTRDLQGLDRTDASPENTLWSTFTAFERDLLVAVAFLKHTDKPATAHQLKQALESWYTDISHADLYNALETLTTNRLLTKPTTTSRNLYRPTNNGYQLLETYIDHLETVCTTPTQSTRLTITLEHPITPGDLERAYCRLEAQR